MFIFFAFWLWSLQDWSSRSFDFRVCLVQFLRFFSQVFRYSGFPLIDSSEHSIDSLLACLEVSQHMSVWTGSVCSTKKCWEISVDDNFTLQPKLESVLDSFPVCLLDNIFWSDSQITNPRPSWWSFVALRPVKFKIKHLSVVIGYYKIVELYAAHPPWQSWNESWDLDWN